MQKCQDVGEALKTILNRINNIKDNQDIEITHTCFNCKYRHGQEGYNQQWGMFYCIHNWCDKDRKLMDSWENNCKHFGESCDFFEEGCGTYNKLTDKEKRRMGIKYV